MKKLITVTILGISIVIGFLSPGCGSGGKQVVPVEDAERERMAALELETRQARLGEAIRLYEQGKMDEAGEILEEVLRKDPSHQEALLYKEYLGKTRICTVYPNDTLSVIADYYYGDGTKWTVLARANGIENPKELKVYQRLRIPWFPECESGKDEVGRIQKKYFKGKNPTKILVYEVKEGDSLGALAKRFYKNSRLRYFLADVNRIEDLSSLKQGSSLKVPVFPPLKASRKARDKKTLRRADRAISDKEFKKAHGYLERITKGSPCWSDARQLLDRCKTEGVSHYDRLGDHAFESSDTEKACLYWQQALSLDPGDVKIQKKLEDARELMNTLKMLPEIP